MVNIEKKKMTLFQKHCDCHQGWDINATYCHEADCPGTPDCNGHGSCNTTGELPLCDCDTGYIGIECQFECVHGYEGPNGTCVCDPCYTGGACKDECDGHGSCTNGTCVCDLAYWGENIDVFRLTL